MDIFVIREGTVVPYLMDAYFDQRLPVLPPEVDVVRLTWQAKNEMVSAHCKIPLKGWNISKQEGNANVDREPI